MSHRLFRLFFVLALIIGLVVIPESQSVRAAGLWYVSNTGNDNDDCLSAITPCATINGAIGKAAAGDTINVATGTYTGSGNEVVLVDKDATLSGGWDNSFSTQNGASVIDGEFSRRGVTVSASITTAMEHFVVQNGDLVDGKNGIDNAGNLKLEKVTVQHNGTNPGSGGVSGINNGPTGTLTLNNSAVINNGTTNNCFGGIWNQGSFTAINSTISGNVSNTIYCYGAALIGYGTVSLKSTTIVNNIGATDIMGAFGTFTLKNSIIGSCGNSTSMTSQGFNIISISDCPITPTTDDQFGTAGAPINLHISPLQDNGGSTFTHALLSLSPAIDAGDPVGCTDQDGNLLTTDQRGFARPQGTRCDIGAYEYTNITTGAAASLAILSGSDQSSALNLAFSKPMRVVALDSQGNRVSGITVTFTAPGSGPSGTFADTGTNTTTIDTDAGGVATTSIFTANDQAGAYTVTASSSGLGSVDFILEQVVRPANDNFASATMSSMLMFDDTVDTQRATTETGEPTPSCAYNGPINRSVWYAFTPTSSGAVSASIPMATFTPVFAAYTGNSLTSLTQVGCQTYTGNLLTLTVNAGTTYYFQVGNLYSWELGGSIQFHLDVPPPPVAGLYFYPNDPSKFDLIQFQDSSYDPANLGIQTYQWNFGDGTIASGYSATHKYTADGDYQVTHTATTIDGRTASITQTVQIRTHDVSITKITTPNSANVGQIKTITVNLRNIAYSETVQIDLYKSTLNGFVWIATVTKSVPILSGNKTTAVNFSYTFTIDDAKLGKVTFKAVATIVGARDAYPADNEAISLQTKVTK